MAEKGRADYPTYPWLLQCLVSTNGADFKGHTSCTHHLFSPNTVRILWSLNFKPAVWSTITEWLSGRTKTPRAASSEQLKVRKVKYPISLRWFFLTESKYTWWNCSWCVQQNKRLYSKRNIMFPEKKKISIKELINSSHTGYTGCKIVCMCHNFPLLDWSNNYICMAQKQWECNKLSSNIAGMTLHARWAFWNTQIHGTARKTGFMK